MVIGGFAQHDSDRDVIYVRRKVIIVDDHDPKTVSKFHEFSTKKTYDTEESARDEESLLALNENKDPMRNMEDSAAMVKVQRMSYNLNETTQRTDNILSGRLETHAQPHKEYDILENYDAPTIVEISAP